LLNTSVAFVAPDTLPPLLKFTPFFRHWYRNGGDPAAETIKVAVVAGLFVRLAGCLTIASGPMEDSTNHGSPLATTKPRATTVPFVGREPKSNCQPPGAREPAPKFSQSRPLVETWKVVRQSSGALPPRRQVMPEFWKLRLSVAGAVLLSRLKPPEP
jgi:hypothetical protein